MDRCPPGAASGHERARGCRDPAGGPCGRPSLKPRKTCDLPLAVGAFAGDCRASGAARGPTRRPQAQFADLRDQPARSAQAPVSDRRCRPSGQRCLRAMLQNGEDARPGRLHSHAWPWWDHGRGSVAWVGQAGRPGRAVGGGFDVLRLAACCTRACETDCRRMRSIRFKISRPMGGVRFPTTSSSGPVRGNANRCVRSHPGRASNRGCLARPPGRDDQGF